MSHGGYLLWAFVALAAGVLILTGHGPHAIGYLPFLILFACPLMHMFMHGTHHRNAAHREQEVAKE